MNAAPILLAKRHGGDKKHADVPGPKIVATIGIRQGVKYQKFGCMQVSRSTVLEMARAQKIKQSSFQIQKQLSTSTFLVRWQHQIQGTI